MKKGVKIIFMEAFRLAIGIAAIGLLLFVLFLLSEGIGWLADWYRQAMLELWGAIRQNPTRVIGVVALIYLGAILSRVWDKLLSRKNKGE